MKVEKKKLRLLATAKANPVHTLAISALMLYTVVYISQIIIKGFQFFISIKDQMGHYVTDEMYKLKMCA